MQDKGLRDILAEIFYVSASSCAVLNIRTM